MLYFKITYKNYFYTGIPPPKKNNIYLRTGGTYKCAIT